MGINDKIKEIVSRHVHESAQDTETQIIVADAYEWVAPEIFGPESHQADLFLTFSKPEAFIDVFVEIGIAAESE